MRKKALYLAAPHEGLTEYTVVQRLDTEEITRTAKAAVALVVDNEREHTPESAEKPRQTPLLIAVYQHLGVGAAFEDMPRGFEFLAVLDGFCKRDAVHFRVYGSIHGAYAGRRAHRMTLDGASGREHDVIAKVTH